MRTDRPPRLAYLCLQPTVEGQGSHAHVWGIVDGLRDRGWRVVVAQPAPSTTTAGLAARVWAAIKAQHRLHAYERSADVVYVRMHPLALPTVWSAARRGIRIVIEVNGPDEDWVIAWPVLARVRWLLRWLLRVQLRQVDAVITVTHGLGRWAEVLGSRPLEVHVIPNGVDPARFHPGATGGPAGLPGRYAVFVGELAAWQGVDVLLDAVATPDWPADLSLVVAGSGRMAAAVEAAAGRDPRIVALGRVPFAQVPALLAGAAVALVPSRDRDGTGVAPIKLFEALAAGVPVVAADVADTNRYPVDVLVSPTAPVAWAAAVAAVTGGAGQPHEPRRTGQPRELGRVTWADRAAQTDAALRGDRSASAPGGTS